MAWSYLGEITGAYDTTDPVTPVSLSSLSLQEGDLVVIAQSSDASLATLGLDRTQGYTVEYSPANTSPGRLFAWKIMGATPDTQIEFNDGSAYHTYAIQGWRGANSTQPDQTTPTEVTGASVNPNSGSITTQTDNALVFTIAHVDDDDTTVSVVPTGYTNKSESNTGQASSTVGATVAFASKQVSPAGAEDPGAWTMAASDAWAANTVAFTIDTGSSSIAPQAHYYRQYT